MTHPRRVIREAAKEILDGLKLDGETLRVETNRVKQAEPDTLPLCVIITDSESSSRAHKGGGVSRTVEMVVAVAVSGDHDDIDDYLDAWAEAIEARFEAHGGGLYNLARTTLDLEPDTEGAEWLAFLLMEYEITI